MQQQITLTQENAESLSKDDTDHICQMVAQMIIDQASTQVKRTVWPNYHSGVREENRIP